MRVMTDCEKCQIEGDLFIGLCPIHKAGPELLEACRIALDWFRECEGITQKEIAQDLQKAISKATGEIA